MPDPIEQVAATQRQAIGPAVTLLDIKAQLDQVITILKGIEERQIKTTAMVSEVKEHEAPVVGSFATVDPGNAS